MDLLRARAQVRQAIALLTAACRDSCPEQVPADGAVELAGLFAQVERLATASKTRYARRATVLGAHKAAGHPNAAGLLAQLSGDARGAAQRTLDMVARVEAHPALRAAFAEGDLSIAQVAVVVSAADADPSAAAAMVAAARAGSIEELKAKARQVRRAARTETDQQARERRVHARRYCRTWTPEEGGVRVDAWLGSIDGARLVSVLEKEADAVFDEARRQGRQEPYERYRADALVRLVTGAGSVAGASVATGPRSAPGVGVQAGAGPRAQAGAGAAPRAGARANQVPGEPSDTPPPTKAPPAPTTAAAILVRVDAAALVRGAVEAGEICEIAGVGPISVTAARSLLGDAFLTLLVTDGVDISTVTSTTRVVPRTLRMALVERDRTCVVPGCPAAQRLEIDHWRVDFAQGGLTNLANLCRLCSRHHAMKSAGLARLLGGPGRWRWVPTDMARTRAPSGGRRRPPPPPTRQSRRRRSSAATALPSALPPVAFMT